MRPYRVASHMDWLHCRVDDFIEKDLLPRARQLKPKRRVRRVSIAESVAEDTERGMSSAISVAPSPDKRGPDLELLLGVTPPGKPRA